jgi:hypothetical protein
MQFKKETLPNIAPVAEVLRNPKYQAHRRTGECGYVCRCAMTELLSLRAQLLREHEEELSSAARSEQDSRQSELGQQRSREHLAQECSPARAPLEVIGGIRQETICSEDPSLQEDLKRHRTH